MTKQQKYIQEILLHDTRFQNDLNQKIKEYKRNNNTDKKQLHKLLPDTTNIDKQILQYTQILQYILQQTTKYLQTKINELPPLTPTLDTPQPPTKIQNIQNEQLQTSSLTIDKSTANDKLEIIQQTTEIILNDLTTTFNENKPSKLSLLYAQTIYDSTKQESTHDNSSETKLTEQQLNAIILLSTHIDQKQNFNTTIQSLIQGAQNAIHPQTPNQIIQLNKELEKTTETLQLYNNQLTPYTSKITQQPTSKPKTTLQHCNDMITNELQQYLSDQQSLLHHLQIDKYNIKHTTFIQQLTQTNDLIDQLKKEYNTNSQQTQQALNDLQNANQHQQKQKKQQSALQQLNTNYYKEQKQ